jgi:hypothetical protein
VASPRESTLQEIAGALRSTRPANRSQSSGDLDGNVSVTYQERIIPGSPQSCATGNAAHAGNSADAPSLSCSLLLSESGIQGSQSLGPNLSSPRARDGRGRFAKGSSGNPGGRPRGIRNPRRRAPDLVARPLGAQALSKLLDGKPHLLRPLAMQLLPPPHFDRSGGASRDRPVVVAHGRGFPAGAAQGSHGHSARRDRARRGRPHRAAGACPVARDQAPRTI